MKFAHVAMRTKDLDAAVAFYELLGMTCTRKKELTHGKATLAFMQSEGSDLSIELVYNWGKDSPYEGGERFGHFGFEADHLRDLMPRIVAGGGTLVREPYLLEGTGPLIAFVADPDGNWVELIER